MVAGAAGEIALEKQFSMKKLRNKEALKLTDTNEQEKGGEGAKNPVD